jgi:phosphatidylglycerol:prolipoprotein diacylglycerol transferase
MWAVVAEMQLFGSTLRVTGFGVFATLGAAVGISLCVLGARRLGFPVFDAFAASALGVVAGTLGAKLLFVAVAYPRLLEAGGAGPSLAYGGLVWYGGVAGGGAAAALYLKAYRLDGLKLADAAVPGLAIGHALGRVGCVMAGCCYGKPTSMPWGLRFPGSPFFEGPVGVALHPVQLYEAALELSLGLAALPALGKWRRGRVFAGWLVVYGAGRLAVEALWRGDDRGTDVLGLSPSSALSLLAMAVGGLLISGRLFDKAQRVKLNPS